MPILSDGIELRDVSFRYSDQHPWVLRHVNLRIPVGKCLALVGLNGAGKTTLVKLLARLYDPNEGQVLWDGIDIREFDPEKLRQHIAAIFQDFTHYDLTAQENIGLGDTERIENTQALRDAAQQAGIHEFLDSLPQGYSTVLSRWLGEQKDRAGVDLSSGQWQKIALARMFMRKADLLMLDEPTAALDAQAEYDLHARFTDLMLGKTSLLITHRFIPYAWLMRSLYCKTGELSSMEHIGICSPQMGSTHSSIVYKRSSMKFLVHLLTSRRDNPYAER